MTYEDYKAHIKTRLTPKRYNHSLAVADEARRLALKYGADPEQAYLAGLLHDVLKDTAPEIQLQILAQFGIMLSPIEKSAPKLYHAMAGAAYLKHVLQIADEEIINAVRYHTTAKKGMTLLEKILYLADYTSADRDYNGVEEMRQAVDISMSRAMEIALCFSITELAEMCRPIHPDTIDAYNEIMLQKVCEQK